MILAVFVPVAPAVAWLPSAPVTVTGLVALRERVYRWVIPWLPDWESVTPVSAA